MNEIKSAMTVMMAVYGNQDYDERVRGAAKTAYEALEERADRRKAVKGSHEIIERAIRSCYTKIRDVKRRFPQSYHETVVLEEVKISAMREKAERELGCGMCNINPGKCSDFILSDNSETGVYLYRNTNGQYELCNNTVEVVSMPAWICPNCGRRLGAGGVDR